MTSTLLVLVLLAADVPALESDVQNREACRAAAEGLRQKDRIQSQLQCRDEYFRRVKEAQAARAAAAAKERQERAQAKRQAEEAMAVELAAKRAEHDAEEARLKVIREAAAAEASAIRALEEKEEARRRTAEAAAEAKREAAESAAARARFAKEKAAREAMEKACGADLMRVEVGMAWETVKACAGPFTSVGQVQRPEGVVSTYRAPGGVVQVLDGKVVAWRRSR